MTSIHDTHMGHDDLHDALLVLTNQQKELVGALRHESPPKKDFWDKFAAASTFVSGVIVALVGLYFTTSYNAQQAARDEMLKSQQIRLAEVELVQKFIPHLNGTDREKKLAIIAISSLGNSELATRLAVLDQSEGAKSALESLATSGSVEEKDLAQRALANFKAFEPHLSNIRGGSAIGRAALDKAIAELKSGVWEENFGNKGGRIRKYLEAVGLPEGMPWSAAFVSWCFVPAPPFKPSGSWRAIEDQFRAKGWLKERGSYTPQPGEIMFVRVDDSDARHGGIVLRHDNGAVEVIEGNISDGGREGFMVGAKRRRLGPNLMFGHVPN